jgi:signal transduction histidine kinase
MISTGSAIGTDRISSPRMTMSRKTRTALIAAAAGLLLGSLAFLFVKSNAADHKTDAQALALLRELGELSRRWDSDALRLTNTLVPVVPAAPDRTPILARIFHEIEHGPASAALALNANPLRAGMEEKQAAYQTLQQRHARSLQTIETFHERLGTLAAEIAAARVREPALGAQASALLAHVERMRAAINVTDIEAHADMARLLEPPLATIVPAAAAAQPALRPAALRAQAAGEEFLSARESEANAWRRFTFLTVGSRVDVLARHMDDSLQAGLAEKERWRVYLAAYAASLLVAIAWLVGRLLATQRALTAANHELEHRVEVRTRDLSHALEQLKESEAQLVQSEKMSSLGQLVAGVAHEVNTPLAYVKNSLATVRERMPQLHETIGEAQKLLRIMNSPEPDATDLGRAMDALGTRLAKLEEHQVSEDLDGLTHDGLHGIDQIAELVQNLRNFARLDRSRVASFDVNEGVRTTLLIAKPALRNVTVSTRLGDIPPITCSPSQINQVLLNLLTNAAQAMDKAQGRIEVATWREGRDTIAIEVSDNGKGIAPVTMPKIFDPFFTTKEVGKGTGLGLSIAYKIVSQHGGRIDVRSEVGVGTIFTVVLPMQPPAALAAAQQAQELAA